MEWTSRSEPLVLSAIALHPFLVTNFLSSTTDDLDDFYLRKAPIIEAIVNFECPEMGSALDVQKLEEIAKKTFQDRYPTIRKIMLAEHHLQVRLGESLTASTTPVLKGFQLFSPDGKDVVEIRFDGFAFHRLAPYDRLNTYLPEIKRCWDLYNSVFRPQTVKKIILRYINRIKIEYNDSPVELNKFLRHGPQLPNENGFFLTGFFHQDEFNAGHLKGKVITAIDSNQPPGELPIIVDNSVFSSDVQATDWDSCLHTITELRRLKNRLFTHTLTQDCLNLFR